MIGEGVEEEEDDNLLERAKGREDWTMTRGWFIDGEDERSTQSISHLLYYPITFMRAGSSSRARLSHPSSALFSLSLRLPEIHRADNAKGPAARRGNALRPSLARAWARHHHAPGRIDFCYVTGNPCRVYDYSLRDGDTAVTRTHTHARATTMITSAKY